MKGYLTVQFSGYDEATDQFIFRDIHTLKEHYLLNREVCAFLDSEDILDILIKKNHEKPKPSYILGLWCGANRFYADLIEGNLYGLIYRCFRHRGKLSDCNISDIKTIMCDMDLDIDTFKYKDIPDLCRKVSEYPLFVNEAKKVQKNFYVLKHGITDVEYPNKIFFNLKYIPHKVRYRGNDYQVQRRLWYSLIFEKSRSYD